MAIAPLLTSELTMDTGLTSKAGPFFTSVSGNYSDDLQLWQAFKNGERQALSVIYQKHFAALYNYGRKICKSEELVKDCIQDLFIDLWKNREGLGETDAIRPYLFTSLRRKLVYELTAVSKEKLSTDEARFLSFEFQAPHETSLILEQISTEQKEKLLAAINSLTKRQREIIFLRFYENLGYPEVSAIMGLHINSAYVLLSQATEELKKKLGQYAYLCIFLSLLGF